MARYEEKKSQSNCVIAINGVTNRCVNVINIKTRQIKTYTRQIEINLVNKQIELIILSIDKKTDRYDVISSFDALFTFSFEWSILFASTTPTTEKETFSKFPQSIPIWIEIELLAFRLNLHKPMNFRYSSVTSLRFQPR